MRFRYLASFDRSFKRLSREKRAKVRTALEGFLGFYENGTRPAGLGLKKLRGCYWEIRAGLHIRIIFLVKRDLVTFVLAGTHNDIKQFLRKL